MQSQPNSTLRLLDAAANRAGEAARVVEDYLRFVLDDRHLTTLCKQLRHDLAGVLASFDQVGLCASRDTLGDVGSELSTDAEMQRPDAGQVCIASFKRLEQSLRSLEEYSKLSDTKAAAQFEQLRYRTYTLEKAVFTTADGRERLAQVRLCVLIDGRESEEAFEQLVESLVAVGVDVLQLRDKAIGDRELHSRARIATRLTRDSDTLLVINDRASVAALVGADGLHIGQKDLPVKEARQIVGPNMLVGVSTSNLATARQAVLDGANYIGIGPVFATVTKSFDPSLGDPFLGASDVLADVAREISLPTFAIGGIDRSNLDRVLDAGITRVAVSQAVIGDVNPAAAAEELSTTLRRRSMLAASESP